MLISKPFQSQLKASPVQPAFSSQTQKSTPALLSSASTAFQVGPSQDQFQRTGRPVHFGSAMPPPKPPGGGFGPGDGDFPEESFNIPGWNPRAGVHGEFLPAPHEEEVQAQEPNSKPKKKRAPRNPDSKQAQRDRDYKDRRAKGIRLRAPRNPNSKNANQQRESKARRAKGIHLRAPRNAPDDQVKPGTLRSRASKARGRSDLSPPLPTPRMQSWLSNLEYDGYGPQNTSNPSSENRSTGSGLAHLLNKQASLQPQEQASSAHQRVVLPSFQDGFSDISLLPEPPQRPDTPVGHWSQRVFQTITGTLARNFRHPEGRIAYGEMALNEGHFEPV